MKKLLFTIAVSFGLTAAYAAKCSSFRVSVTDACGQRLSFTVVCNSSCTCAELGAFADNFIFNHTNDSGCYFL